MRRALFLPLLCASTAATAQSAPDPVLQRLEALEDRVRELEARNRELEGRAAASAPQAATLPATATSGERTQPVRFGWGPTLSDTGGRFTFRPRGIIDVDAAFHRERAGDYDFNDGTAIRRARLGFSGSAFGLFDYSLSAELVGGRAQLMDAFVTYTGIERVGITVGHHKAPYGLESNQSDSYLTFMERGMASNAFGAIGAERRIGVSASYAAPRFTASLGLFGAPEAAGRNEETPDEPWSVNARMTWEPLRGEGRLLHLGVGAYRAARFGADTISISDRPNVRVDDGRIVNALVQNADRAVYLGGEAALVLGPFSVQGEYGRLAVDRLGGLPDADFQGGYGFVSWFPTGESRTFEDGLVTALRPWRPFDPAKGQWGAVELALRFDKLDLTDRDLSSLDRDATSLTAALNWYLNGNLKLMFNYIRFTGENSPLVANPAIDGTTAKGEAFAGRLHLDF